MTGNDTVWVWANGQPITESVATAVAGGRRFFLTAKACYEQQADDEAMTAQFREREAASCRERERALRDLAARSTEDNPKPTARTTG